VNEIKKGDVVELKSGGPHMTVEIPRDDVGLVACSWFNKGEHCSQSFVPEALRVVPDNEQGREMPKPRLVR